VPDPYGGPQAGYAQALDLIQGAVQGLVARLAQLPGIAAGQVPVALPSTARPSTGPEVPASGPGGA
jgi:hypothetical protein